MNGNPRPLTGFRRWAAILLPIVLALRAILFVFQLHREHHPQAATTATPATETRPDLAGAAAGTAPDIDDKVQVMQIVSDYVAEHDKGFDVIGKPMRITDAGRVWHVDFSGPDGPVAGAPVFDVDKASHKVTSATRQP